MLSKALQEVYLTCYLNTEREVNWTGNACSDFEYDK